MRHLITVILILVSITSFSQRIRTTQVKNLNDTIKSIIDEQDSVIQYGSRYIITDEERTKLNTVIQSDWDATSGFAEIQNKPTDLLIYDDTVRRGILATNFVVDSLLDNLGWYISSGEITNTKNLNVINSSTNPTFTLGKTLVNNLEVEYSTSGATFDVDGSGYGIILTGDGDYPIRINGSGNVYWLPGSDGSSSQVLTTNGSGGLYWSAGGGSGSGTVALIQAGNGMNFGDITTSGYIKMGTPSTINATSTNTTSTTSHTHELDIDAGDIDITDAGGKYTSTNVEGALQELSVVKSTTPQSITTSANATSYLNFYTTASSSKTITFSNVDDGDTGQIRVSYSAASVITFAHSTYSINVATNINSTGDAVLSKSSGVAIYSYYVSNSNIYINGTQNYN